MPRVPELEGQRQRLLPLSSTRPPSTSRSSRSCRYSCSPGTARSASSEHPRVERQHVAIRCARVQDEGHGGVRGQRRQRGVPAQAHEGLGRLGERGGAQEANVGAGGQREVLGPVPHEAVEGEARVELLSLSIGSGCVLGCVLGEEGDWI
jgi:hypothetical protein